MEGCYSVNIYNFRSELGARFYSSRCRAGSAVKHFHKGFDAGSQLLACKGIGLPVTGFTGSIPEDANSFFKAAVTDRLTRDIR
jgi:hypothetical protein